jgi:hypothetical protein
MSKNFNFLRTIDFCQIHVSSTFGGCRQNFKKSCIEIIGNTFFLNLYAGFFEILPTASKSTANMNFLAKNRNFKF